MLLSFILENKGSIVTNIVSTFLIYILIRFRYQRSAPKDVIPLKRKTVEKLIEEFEPLPIVPAGCDTSIPKIDLKWNFSNYDVQNIGHRYKEMCKDAIKKYGVGTCGPRGFYGTLDVHLELEKEVSRVFKKESAVIYSNYFTCLQSVVSCFCKQKNTVYFSSNATEPILRGLTISGSGTVAYDDLESLKSRLRKEVEDKYVIVEHLEKNTGRVLDLDELKRMKHEYGFRIIMDVGYAYPYVTGDYDFVDVVTGSFAYWCPIGGGFSCGRYDASEYQRLASPSYVFSASLPSFMTVCILAYLKDNRDFSKLQERIEYARSRIRRCVSDKRSPAILVNVRDALEAKRKLNKEGYAVGVNCGYIRLCINEETQDRAIERVAEILNNEPL